MTDPVLHTPRLTLRLPQPSDWPAVSAFGQSARARFVGGAEPDEFQRWRAFLAVSGHWALKGFGFFTVLHGDLPVGRVGVIEHIMWPEPELGYHLFDGFEGHGFVTEAAIAVREWAATEKGLGPLVSYIDPANAQSQRVAQRLGATYESDITLRGTTVQVWRHPAPDADGSPEAYA